MEETQKSNTHVVTERKEEITIPYALLNLKISTKEGNERFLTCSESMVLAYTKQYPNKQFSARTLSRRLSLSVTSVARAIKTLTEANLIKRVS